MISFIIVDDEPLALENFQELCDWKAHGYHLAGTAANGMQAQTLIEKTHPDIVFTDIRMPIMDGTKLCKWIYEQQLDIRVVILTGYQDFEYARIALSYGVKEYLLKNQIEVDNVLKLLEKLSKEIKDNRKKQAMEQNHYYQRIMLNMTPLSETPQPKSSGVCCGILLQVKEPYILKHFELDEARNIPLEMDKLIELLPTGSSFSMPGMWMGEMNWGLLFESTEQYSMEKSGFTEFLSAFWSRLRVYFATHYKREIFGIYDQCQNTPDKVKECLTRMYKFAVCGCFIQSTDCCAYQTVKSLYRNTNENHAYIRSLIDQLTAGASTGSAKQITESMDAMQREYMNPLPDAGKFYYTCDHLFEQLELLCTENSLAGLKEYAVQTHEKLTKITAPKDIWRWFEQEFMAIARLHTIVNEHSGNRKIKQALEYIHKNYTQNLTARQVGESVGLSKVYFCNRFKQETGVNFGDYLTTYRISVAKYLLTNGDYKIYEVAEMTGYGSPQYFSQLFQKKTGMTPQAYKTYGEK